MSYFYFRSFYLSGKMSCVSQLFYTFPIHHIPWQILEKEGYWWMVMMVQLGHFGTINLNGVLKTQWSTENT